MRGIRPNKGVLNGGPECPLAKSVLGGIEMQASAFCSDGQKSSKLCFGTFRLQPSAAEKVCSACNRDRLYDFVLLPTNRHIPTQHSSNAASSQVTLRFLVNSISIDLYLHTTSHEPSPEGSEQPADTAVYAAGHLAVLTKSHQPHHLPSPATWTAAAVNDEPPVGRATPSGHSLRAHALAVAVCVPCSKWTSQPSKHRFYIHCEAEKEPLFFVCFFFNTWRKPANFFRIH